MCIAGAAIAQALARLQVAASAARALAKKERAVAAASERVFVDDANAMKEGILRDDTAIKAAAAATTIAAALQARLAKASDQSQRLPKPLTLPPNAPLKPCEG